MNLQKIIKINILGLFNGNTRTLLIKKNILLSFLIKSFGVLISFLLVPITIKYLNPNEYGVWLTLSSILGWIYYFDIGLGNGLRNKLSEALASNNKKLGKKYVSTTFILLIIIMLILYSIFLLLKPFLNWNKILNISDIQDTNLSLMITIVLAFFCLQFIFKTISYVLLADQKPALNDLITLLGNLLSFITIYLLTLFTSGSLFYVSIIFSVVPFITLFIIFLILFITKYKDLRPSFSYIDFKYVKDLMGIGIQFFILQLTACIIIYSSTNIIISRLFGNINVTIYNIAYRYFNIITMIYMIILSPFWSAVTEAFVKNDLLWIKESVKKLLFIILLIAVLLLFMLLFSNTFYKIWIGNTLKVPFKISIVVAIYTIFYNWQNTFIYIINGIGKIKLQLFTTLMVAILYIPLALFFGQKYGIFYLLIISCLSLLPTTILMPIQCIKICNSNAKGIWFK